MKKVITISEAIRDGWYKPNICGGQCHCGCGEPAPIADRTCKTNGMIKGEPRRYIHGHKLWKPGPEHPRFKDGSKIASLGYLRVWVSPDHPFASMRNSNGYIMEHRLVMANAIGRVLTPEEVVHHVNENRSDNRLENLMLFANDNEHKAHHKEMREDARQTNGS